MDTKGLGLSRLVAGTVEAGTVCLPSSAPTNFTPLVLSLPGTKTCGEREKGHELTNFTFKISVVS